MTVLWEIIIYFINGGTVGGGQWLLSLQNKAGYENKQIMRIMMIQVTQFQGRTGPRSMRLRPKQHPRKKDYFILNVISFE